MNKTNKYNHREIQKKWDKKWEAQKIYQPDLDNAKKPYYVLYMFPYPSAEGLHVGHAFSGTGADVYARFKRMQGNDVFHPMGFDAFGIHSENFAIKINDHPQNLINRATKRFREQFDSLGFSYDWSHTVNTSSPDYYKWTQWLFIQLFKAGLAEKKKAKVNWCPSCKTVLADEQVLQKSKIKNQKSKIEDERTEERVGVCERCGTEVEWKELDQWFFKITKYADRLLEGLDRIDWTEKVKLAQRNWIGKSEGLLIRFKIKDLRLKNGSEVFVEVFTTKPETVDGASFIVLSPEHPLIQKILDNNSQSNEVKKYVEMSKKKSKDDIDKEKTGVFSGLCAINPVTNKEIPVWIADYVLMAYGTGAIMAVPFADERDKKFAEKFNLPITETTFKAKPEGEKQTHYHLRDWLISRQRYWGAPIPMIFCDKDGWQPVPEKDLPVLLPYIENFKPLGTGIAPLAQDEKFVNVKCPVCGGKAVRETDVADTFLDSSWYFLRYPAADLEHIPFPSENWRDYLEKADDRKLKMEDRTSKIENGKSINPQSSSVKNRSSIIYDLPSTLELEIENSRKRSKWLPVTMYIGGAEHSVLHLLYSRFIWKVLFDLGYLDFSSKGRPASSTKGRSTSGRGWDEPFTKFRAHGLLIKAGAKMSKSKGNVVNPDEYVSKYGADTLRAYLMFLGPYDAGGDFRDSGIEGMERFLKRVVRLVENYLASNHHSKGKSASFSANSEIERSVNKTIKGVGDDVESLRYNTALAKIMELVNDLTSANRVKRDSGENITIDHLKTLVILLAPFVPYLTEELWEKLGGLSSVHLQPWPTYDEASIKEDQATIAVQINGKLRSTITIDSSQLTINKYVQEKAIKDQRVSKYIKGKQIKKVIYVPGKIINFVV